MKRNEETEEPDPVYDQGLSWDNGLGMPFDRFIPHYEIAPDTFVLDAVFRSLVGYGWLRDGGICIEIAELPTDRLEVAVQCDADRAIFSFKSESLVEVNNPSKPHSLDWIRPWETTEDYAPYCRIDNDAPTDIVNEHELAKVATVACRFLHSHNKLPALFQIDMGQAYETSLGDDKIEVSRRFRVSTMPASYDPHNYYLCLHISSELKILQAWAEYSPW